MASEHQFRIDLDPDVANQLLAEFAARNRTPKESLDFAATLMAVAAQIYRGLVSVGAPFEDTTEAFALVAHQMYEFERSRPKPLAT